MYIINGICYAGDREEDIEITSVVPLEDMMLLLTFSSGETRLFDASILKGPVFEALKDEAIFSRPIIESGVVTWNNGLIDCAPEYMYEHSCKYDKVS